MTLAQVRPLVGNDSCELAGVQAADRSRRQNDPSVSARQAVRGGDVSADQHHVQLGVLM
jgi:hypothetical protein